MQCLQVGKGQDQEAVVLWCVSQSLEAKTTYVAHQGVVEDVAWHQHHTDIFGSVGDDKQLILWDTRKPPRDGKHHTMQGSAAMALISHHDSSGFCQPGQRLWCQACVANTQWAVLRVWRCVVHRCDGCL